MESQQIASRIRAMRGQLGLSQSDMALLMNVNTMTVLNLEKGKTSPKISYFENMTCLGVNCLPYINGSDPDLFTIKEDDSRENIQKFLEEGK